ncbi:MAG: elongation factor G [Sphingobacteriales bacterium]|nr:elongation factor G [Sphingobacteriales bacterium]
MSTFDSNKIKNVVLLGHAGSGKTTLAESMLFEAGAITRRGSIEGQNTVSDYHTLEQERRNSIFSSIMNMQWKDNKINLIDTPGFDDFVGEVIAALRVADTGVMVLNAQNGVEVGTEIIWDYTEQFKTPMLFVVNQLDSDKANFDETLNQARDRFGSKVTIVQYPLNSGPAFNSIVDVLKMVVYKFPANGGKPEKLPIPDAEKEKANELHNNLVETIAANDEGLMEIFFDKGNLDEEEMVKGLKLSMIHHDIFPVFCCSGKQNMGTGRVMGFIHDIAPAAVDMPPIQRVSGQTLSCDPKGFKTLFVFKTSNEANLGLMTYFKVCSGTLKAGDELTNSKTENSERLSQLYVVNGKNRNQVNELVAGDIGATVKLKNTATNTTLFEKTHPFHISPIEFPEPRMQAAIHAENSADIEKIAQALHAIHVEDPTLLIENSQELKQMIISGQGELHLNMVKWKVENTTKAKFEYIQPRIPYRETIRKSAQTQYRHKKQSGGAGQFAEVHMMVEHYYDGMPEPANMNVRSTEEIQLDWGGKLVFKNCVVGGAIDTRFMSSIMKGIMERMVEGPLTGSYVRDVRVCVYDGKMHPVDSNDNAFRIAARSAFRDAFKQADPQILEPIYDVEIMVTSHAMGDVIGDLQTRRALIMGMDTAGHYQVIKACAPLMELYKYSSSLRSLSQGAAKHTQRFAEYRPVPADVQAKLIAAHKAEEEEH